MDAPRNPPSPAMPVHRPIYKKWWFWILATPLLLFIALVIYRIPFVIEKDKTLEAVAQIHAQKLTIEDVNGEHLPPPPDPAQVDATIEGVDANKNGIRDDVELAIFKKYPNEVYPVRSGASNGAKIRAAELQYAKALQMYLTQVFNSDTLAAVAQEDERASSCITDQLRIDNTIDYADLRREKNAVKDMVVNTEKRQERANQNTGLIKSFSSPEGPYCDVEPKSLRN